MTKEQVIRSLVIFFDFTEEDAESQFEQFFTGNPCNEKNLPANTAILIATVG